MHHSYPRKIYAIKHNITGKVYIGSTGKTIEERYRRHISALRKHKHPSKLMQKDFEEFGENYTVYELGEITEYAYREKEYEYILKYKTYDPEIGYNQGDYNVRRKRSSIQMNFSTNNDDLFGNKEEL